MLSRRTPSIKQSSMSTSRLYNLIVQRHAVLSSHPRILRVFTRKISTTRLNPQSVDVASSTPVTAPLDRLSKNALADTANNTVASRVKLAASTVAGQSQNERTTSPLQLVEKIQGGHLLPKERLVLIKQLRTQLLNTGDHSKPEAPMSVTDKTTITKKRNSKPKAPKPTKGKVTVAVGTSDSVAIKATPMPQTLEDALQSKIKGDNENKGKGRSRSRRQIHTRPKITRVQGKQYKVGPVEVHTGAAGGLKGRMAKAEIETICSADLKLIPIEQEPLDVPTLSHGLDRILFNPGVYHLQDPRSRVFNFDPYLQTIMPVHEFDFNALKRYITSSKDQTLLETALAKGKKYTGSTSSMTSSLAHFHFLLSQWRPVNTGSLSQMFPVEYNTFTTLSRIPSSIFLRWKDGAYAIDADKQYDTGNILSMLGKSMEKLLTLPKEDYEKYRKENSDQISEEERNESEQYHYTTIGDFLLRSQLDAHDPRLPGTGMFDLKTRAVISIRMDHNAYEEGRGYQLRTRHGEWQSFEREYYDMIRSAFLKYSLQVRMGRMDGIFVAFHNTERIFGFQYISLSEMDLALHGSEDTTIGDLEFKLSLDLLNRVLDKATAKFPEQSLHIQFETRETDKPFMYIFAEALSDEKIDMIQERPNAAIAEFETRVLGLKKDEASEERSGWDALQAKVEEAIEKDELEGVEVASETIDGSLDPEVEDKAEDKTTPLETAAVIGDTESIEVQKSFPEQTEEADFVDEDVKLGPAIAEPVKNVPKDILAMTLTIRNKVDKKYLERPETLEGGSKWDIEYALAEVSEAGRARKLFEMSKFRRRIAMTKATEERNGDDQYDEYIETIRLYTRLGREWRAKQNEIDAQRPLKVLGAKTEELIEEQHKGK